MIRPSMTDRQRYQLAKRTEAVGVQYWGVKSHERQGARGGFLLAGQGYTGDDWAAVSSWMAERAAGYPLNLGLCQHNPDAPRAVRCKRCGGLGNYCTCCP